jgi:hypothetical protein
MKWSGLYINLNCRFLSKKKNKQESIKDSDAKEDNIIEDD